MNDYNTILNMILIFSISILLVCIFGILGGWIVKVLWNFIMPVIFNLPTINYLQGLVIYILCNILFKPSATKINNKEEK